MKGIINHSTDLVNGGCNACPTVKTTSYSLTLDGINTPLENLDVVSLVMVIALKSGYRQELMMDFMDEYIAFIREENTVQLFDEYGIQVYKKGIKEMKVALNYPNNDVLFKKTNEILTELFEIETVEFVIE